MSSTQSKKLIPFEAGPDVKAHVYQQLTELERFSVPASSMVVLMRKSSPTKKHGETFAVDLVVSVGDATLEAEGRSRNVYEAIRQAKENMAVQLDAVQNSIVSSREREIEIQTLMQSQGGSHLIH